MTLEEMITEFDTKLKGIHEEWEKEDLADTENGKIYHYRNAESGSSIIRNRELWFADYKYLCAAHDKAELKIGFDAILECVVKKSKSEFDFWYNFGSSFSKLYDPLSVHVLSCCYEKGNHDVWKKYGNKKKGIALGLKFIPREVNELNGLWEEKYLMRVMYDKDEFEKRINKFLEETKKYIHPNKDHGVSDYEKKLIEVLASHLLIYIPCLKDPSFAWEKECRIVMPGFYVPDGSRSPCGLPIDRFKSITDYKNSHFAQNFDLAELKEVILGKDIDKDEESKLIDLCKQLNVPIVKLED